MLPCTVCRRFLSAAAGPAGPADARAPRALAVYKRLLLTARRLPAADRGRAEGEIRAAFRSSRGEVDPALIASLLRTAHDKLSYLRMVTPRVPGEGEGSGSGSGAPRATSRLAMVDGELREVGRGSGSGAGKAQSSYGAGNLDPDQVRRHEASMQRMRFMNRPGGVPQGPFGR